MTGDCPRPAGSLVTGLLRGRTKDEKIKKIGKLGQECLWQTSLLRSTASANLFVVRMGESAESYQVGRFQQEANQAMLHKENTAALGLRTSALWC